MVSMCQRNRRIILESPHTSDWFVLLHGKYKHPHLIYNKQTLHTTERDRKAKLKSLKWTFVCVDMRVCVCVRRRSTYGNMSFKRHGRKTPSVFDLSVNHWATYYSNWIITTV